MKPKGTSNALERARLSASASFNKLPDPDFKYGMAVRFDPSRIALPYRAGGISAANPKLTVTGAADVDEIGRSQRKLAGLPSFLSSDSFRVWAWFDSRAWSGPLISVPADGRAEVNFHFDETVSTGHQAVILAGEGSSVSVVEHVVGKSARRGAVRTASTLILAAPGSCVRLARFQALPEGFDEFYRVQAALASSARLDVLDVTVGGSFCQTFKEIHLTGSGSSLISRGAYFAGDGQSYDISETVRHGADGTNCDLAGRCAVANGGHAAMRPLIAIPRGLKGCSGRQKDDIIILGRDAEADAMPFLEIAAGDASCSHSSAIGRIDPEHLFHLNAKGISRRDAERLLVSGFLEPAVSGLKEAELDDQARKIIAQKFR